MKRFVRIGFSQVVNEVAGAERCECQLAGLKSVLRVLEKVIKGPSVVVALCLLTSADFV